MVADGDVHVWQIPLDRSETENRHLAGLLSTDECERAQRFFFPRDQARFVVGRATLRLLLARYVDRDPRALSFCYGAHGKPELVETPRVHFNVTHSNGLGLVAVSGGRPVGVDVERVRPIVGCEQVADRFFTPAEREYLRTIDRPEQRDRAFLVYWTRKEAYVKARGKGLSFPLHTVDVATGAGEPVRLREQDDNEEPAPRWSLDDVRIDEDHVAALAVEGEGCRMTRLISAPWNPGLSPTQLLSCTGGALLEVLSVFSLPRA